MESETAAHTDFQARSPLPIRSDPPSHLPHPPSGRTLVIAAGKAAASMAVAVEQHWPRDAALEGLVVTRYKTGYRHAAQDYRSRHPVPDETGESPRRKFCDK